MSDDDICGEIKNLFVRINTLISRFHPCAHNVETVLLKSFCLCIYDLALWYGMVWYGMVWYSRFSVLSQSL